MKWLFLVYQLPARPSNARVKTWRRLHQVGALPWRNSGYVLPNTAENREHFEWLRGEVGSMKGQATVFEAQHLDAGSEEEIVREFRRARQRDFEAIRAAARKAGPAAGRLLKSLRERLAAVTAIDFFSADGRDKAEAALDRLDQRLSPRGRIPAAPEGKLMPNKFRNRIWITRPRPGIDRMGSAWLIRRFIDPRARFRFAAKPPSSAQALPFDMYGVEFSHHGNDCTFETLVRRFGVRDPAVRWLARIVHDLDLKEARYGAPEAAAVGRLVEGLRQMHANDQRLLEAGMDMFEALYRSFQTRTSDN